MLAIKLLLTTLLLLIALLGVFYALFRARGSHKRWKAMEPQLIRDIEKSLGQKIECTLQLNANDSQDFTRGEIFWLWLAFTREYACFALRDSLARTGEGCIGLARRSDSTVRRLDKRFTEIEFREHTSGERMKYFVMVRSRDLEVLERYLPSANARRTR